MTEEDFKKLLEEAISPIVKRLDDPDTGLQRINAKLDTNTESVVNIEKDIKAYGDMYKLNNDNMKKLEKRIEPLEENVGIEPPPELVLSEVH